MTPAVPSVVIRLPLEGAPSVYAEAANEAERLRLADWIEAHPELLEIVVRAVEQVREATSGRGAAK